MVFALHRRNFIAATANLAILGCASAPAPSGRTPIVKTTSGALEGVVEDGVYAFKGVRYAAPPLGAWRFKAPRPLEASKDIVDASAFGAPAVQMYARPSGEPQSSLGKLLARSVFPTALETRAGAEDCLFLNVWTRGVGDRRRRAIMVWFHGGGMAYGSGAWPAFWGAHLAQRDVVVVTVNHRLNAFGYCYLGEAFGEEFADSGNAGHLDLVAALNWVGDNAEAFGGDRDNVTIFGQSGGGAKVSALLATPAAEGLFQRAIVESGAGLRLLSKDQATHAAQVLLDELSIAKGDWKALQAAPAERIRMALYTAQAKGRVNWGPVLDGRTLARHPFDPDAPAQARDIPLLIGTTNDEAALFAASAPWYGRLTDAELAVSAAQIAGSKGEALIGAFRKLHPRNTPTALLTDIMTAQQFWAPTLLEAERKGAQPAKVFMYRMDWETPIGGGVYRAGHSVETPFVFDNVEHARDLVGPGPAPQAMAAQMSGAWLAFARRGDPNTSALPRWPRYDLVDRSTMIFNLDSRVERDPNAPVRKILLG